MKAALTALTAVVAATALVAVAVTPFRLLNAVLVGVPDFGFPGRTPADEFSEAARRIADTTNELYGQAAWRALQDHVKEGAQDSAAQCRQQTELAAELVKHGDLADAVAAIEGALAAAEKPSLQRLAAEAHRVRMLVYLRQLQDELGHAPDDPAGMIYPPAPLNSPAARRAAQEAQRSLRAYRASQPPDALGLAWLENLLAMWLGDHPQSLDAADRIEPRPAAQSATFPRFVDRVGESGLAQRSVGGAVAVGDVDRDGRLDVVCSSMGLAEPLRLFANQGGGAFAERGDDAGLSGQLGGSGCQLVDYNNDGLLDLFVLRGGWLLIEGRVRNSLLEQQPDGSFRDVTDQAGLAYPAYPSQTGVWGDFDNDGDLDLFVGNESLIEVIGLRRGSFPSQLFRNNGDGTFTESARESGLVVDRLVKGAAAGDYDNDGDLDLFVSAYSLWDETYGVNRFFQNDGHGKFSELGRKLGVMEPAQSVAAGFFDFDHDGWLDLLVVPHGQVIDGDPLAAQVRDAQGQPHGGQRPRLFYNVGGRRFRDVALEVGLDHPYLALGAGLGDLDNDGYLDLYLGTGGPHLATLVPNVMLRNDAGQKFLDVTAAGGLGRLEKTQALALADLDDDGDRDIYANLGGFYTQDKSAKALLVNPGTPTNHCLTLSLIGTQSNRQGVGARVKVTVAGPQGSRTFHHVHAGGAMGAPSDRLEIGLGPAAKISELEIWWPTSNTRQTFTDVELDRWIQVTEGQKEWATQPVKRPLKAD